MQHFKVGDLVMLINSTCYPDIIGHVGTVMHSEGHFCGYDKWGRFVSGIFVVVDLPGDINRHGTTLWYLKPNHLIKITPDDDIKAETTVTPDTLVV
jgi:hypothetical protein